MAGLLPQPPLQTYNNAHDILQDSDIGNISSIQHLHHDHVLALMGLPNHFLLTEVKSLIKVVKPRSKKADELGVKFLINVKKWEDI